MTTHLDFIQYLPEWKIPEKYLQDKEVLEALMEEVKFAIENFEDEIYPSKENGFVVWKFADRTKWFTIDYLYICHFCDLKNFNFLKKCVRLSLGAGRNCSIEKLISVRNKVDYCDINLMEIPEKNKLRLYWLKQLEVKLKGLHE